MTSSLRSCSGLLAPQMQPKSEFWFLKLSMEWWERYPQGNMCKYGQKKLKNNTYPARGANAKGGHNILKNSDNNVGLECWMQQDKYNEVTNNEGSDLIPGRTSRK